MKIVRNEVKLVTVDVEGLKSGSLFTIPSLSKINRVGGQWDEHTIMLKTDEHPQCIEVSTGELFEYDGLTGSNLVVDVTDKFSLMENTHG